MQLIRPGNRLALMRNVSPTGENASTSLNLILNFWIMYVWASLGSSGFNKGAFAFISFLKDPVIASSSSLANKSETQPALSNALI